MTVLTIDLDAPPATRWAGLAPHAPAIRELCATYVEDLGGLDAFAAPLSMYEARFLRGEHVAEIEAIAKLVGVRHAEVALANLYYDALKFAFSGLLGCTAFAVETQEGPLHARNLDWHAPKKVLSKHTLVTELRRGGEVVARTVGWPGFVGAFSGVAPGRFSVSLNAVLSDDMPSFAPPITFLLRDVLETAVDFDDAVLRLAETEVASDSLLLVVGTQPGERVVIERTPKRHALREAPGPLVVTNDYRALEDTPGAAETVLGQTACGRFDRASALAGTHLDEAAAFRVLSDRDVKMDITVQQMVFRPATGAVWVSGRRVL